MKSEYFHARFVKIIIIKNYCYLNFDKRLEKLFINYISRVYYLTPFNVMGEKLQLQSRVFYLFIVSRNFGAITSRQFCNFTCEIVYKHCNFAPKIDHFTVVCSVTRPLNGSKAGGDFVLIQTMLTTCIYMTKVTFA